MNSVPSGSELIRFERARQLLYECFHAEYDDLFTASELERAAEVYAAAANAAAAHRHLSVPPMPMPRRISWKPCADPVRNMVKSGALYSAEADRLLRAGDRVNADRCEALSARCAAYIDDMMRGAGQQSRRPAAA